MRIDSRFKFLSWTSTRLYKDILEREEQLPNLRIKYTDVAIWWGSPDPEKHCALEIFSIYIRHLMAGVSKINGKFGFNPGYGNGNG
jgi:hypothetical protein